MKFANPPQIQKLHIRTRISMTIRFTLKPIAQPYSDLKHIITLTTATPTTCCASEGR